MPILKLRSDGSLIKVRHPDEGTTQLIKSGEGIEDVDFTGLIWDRTGGLRGQSGGVTQFNIDLLEGSLKFGGGTMSLDENGLVQEQGGDRVIVTPYGGFGSYQNIIQYPEDFTAWFDTNVTVTANHAESPTLETNADRLEFTALNGNVTTDTASIPMTSPGEFYIFSVWLRGPTSGTITLEIANELYGEVQSQQVDVTTEWSRASIYGTFTVSSGLLNCSIKRAPGDLTDIWAWGASIEKKEDSSYEPTVYAPFTQIIKTRGVVLRNLNASNFYAVWEPEALNPGFLRLDEDDRIAISKGGGTIAVGNDGIGISDDGFILKDISSDPATPSTGYIRLYSKSQSLYARLAAGTVVNLRDHSTLLNLTSGDPHTQYLLADGTRALSADWDAGANSITAEQLISDIATGTAPFVVASTTAVTNLNSDIVDGVHGTEIFKHDGSVDMTGNIQLGSNLLIAGSTSQIEWIGPAGFTTSREYGEVLRTQLGDGSAWFIAAGTKGVCFDVRIPARAYNASVRLTSAKLYYYTGTTTTDYISEFHIIQSDLDGTITALFSSLTDRGNATTGWENVEMLSSNVNVTDYPLYIYIVGVSSGTTTLKIAGIRLVWEMYDSAEE